MPDEKAKKDWDYNIWITVYEGDTNPMDVKIDLDRYPDGKLWKTKTKKGKDCVYGLLTIPGSSKKIKVVAFERNRDNIAPVKKEKGSELFED